MLLFSVTLAVSLKSATQQNKATSTESMIRQQASNQGGCSKFYKGSRGVHYKSANLLFFFFASIF